MKTKLLLIFLTISTLHFNVSAQNPDLWILQQINSPAKPGDNAMKVFSNSIDVVAVATPVSMLVTGLVTKNHDLTLKSYETGSAILLTALTTQGLKKLFHRNRPYIEHPELFTGKSNDSDYSFPSGHTSIAFSTATSLAIAYPKWYVIVPAYTYASLVGYSRMYLGLHYPSDVLGGAILGTGSAILMWKINKILTKKVPEALKN